MIVVNDKGLVMNHAPVGQMYSYLALNMIIKVGDRLKIKLTVTKN